MSKLIVLLILIEQGTFVAGIDSKNGLMSQLFPNTSQGAEAFFSFVAPVIEKEGGGYRICLVPSGDGNVGPIVDALESEKIEYILLNTATYKKFTTARKLDPSSVNVAANACVDFLKIFGPKTF